MFTKRDRNEIRVIRHERVRKKISGTPEMPRLCVYRSLNHIYPQVIDDVAGKTLVSCSTLDPAIKGQLAELDKKGAAKLVGKTVADFKAAVSGVKLYYELAEPEEYLLLNVDNNYISSDYGVERFDSVVPCNANNLYYMRSLAGETRNFLDRLMAGLGTSDATAVADRILAVVNPAIEPTTIE